MTEKGTGIYEIDELGACEKLLDELRSEQADCAVLVVKYGEALRALGEITQIIDGLTADNAQHIKDLVIATIAEVVQDDRIS
jgi:hypothetical protein